jgi:FAT domain
MAYRAYCARINGWTSLFASCRTAFRTEAGLGLAQFLFPFILLDRLCFGSEEELQTIYTEVNDVLTFPDNNRTPRKRQMSLTDRRKAISSIFSVLNYFEAWAEPEGKLRQPKPSSIIIEWKQADSATRLKGFINKISLTLRAKAAATVDMHATAVRYLEMASRASVVNRTFGDDSRYMGLRSQNRSQAVGNCPSAELSLMKNALSALNDFETVATLCDDDSSASPRSRVRDSIRQAEAMEDWQGALSDYECAVRLNVRDTTSRIGILRCLVKLGHFESALRHANVGSDSKDHQPPLDTVPLAVEAAWRLGRWDTLSGLVEYGAKSTLDPSSQYQIHLGQALLHLWKKDVSGTQDCITNARLAVMDGLSNVARESYSRSYDHVVQLQALREIEDVAAWMCSCAQRSDSLADLAEANGLSWNRRLDIVSSTGASTVANARMVLARLGGDAGLEGSLHLRMGKRSRKNGQLKEAETAFAQSEIAFACIATIKQARLNNALHLQVAKLKHAAGDYNAALRLLNLHNLESMGTLEHGDLVLASHRRIAGILGDKPHDMDERQVTEMFVRGALVSTRWMVESGLKGVSEIMSRFRVIQKLSPSYEKGTARTHGPDRSRSPCLPNGNPDTPVFSLRPFSFCQVH